MKKLNIVLADYLTDANLFVNLLSATSNLTNLNLPFFLRSEIESNSDFGKKLKIEFEKGNLLSEKLETELLSKAINQVNGDIVTTYFPRSISSCRSVENLVKSGNIKIDSIWHLNLCNINFISAQKLAETDYAQKYEMTQNHIIERINNSKSQLLDSIIFLGEIYSVNKIDVDYESINNLETFYKEKIDNENKHNLNN